MNILVVGSGGREHALAWKLSQSEQAEKIYVAPGNGGTEEDFTNVDIGVMNFDGLVDFAKEKEIDLVVVGPEDPLDEGIVDRFEEEGIRAFGPNKECAKFESSKDFTKNFLIKHNIPTAKSFTTSDYNEAIRKIKYRNFPIVIKADGLSQGKGVVIAENFEEADRTLEDMLQKDIYGQSGSTVVIEEYLTGEEQSLLCFVSNNKIIPMETARDYKKISEGDLGLNTGGVGVFSPSNIVGEEVNKNIRDVLEKIEKGFDEDGFVYNGILFIGFMIEDDQPKVLEFNVRFGDPETEVLMPRLESDLLEIINKALDGELEEEDLSWSDKAAVGVVMFSEGYPQSYEKGFIIENIPEIGEDEVLFHNGTIIKDGNLLTNGGRVITAVGLAATIEEAREKAYNIVEQIQCKSLSYRKDIGEI